MIHILDNAVAGMKMTENDKKLSTRFYFLDNIKWFLAMTVIMHHSFDHLKHVYKSHYQMMDTFNGFNQSYFMDLFFFISAYFIIPSFTRKGLHDFLRDKLIRLGIPVLITMFIINILISLIQNSDFNMHGIANYYKETFISMQWANFMGVTWFCFTLLVFTLVWMLFLPGQRTKNSGIDKRPLPSILTIIIFCSCMIPVNIFASWLQSKVGENFLGFHLIKYFPTYIAAFIFGIYAYKWRWLEQIDVQYAIFGLVIFMVTWVIVGSGLFDVLHIDVYVALRTFMAIGMSLFVIYLFKRLFNSTNTVVKELTRSAYPAYVFQNIFLTFCFIHIKPMLTGNYLVTTITIGLISIVCSFLFGSLVCRLPLLKNVF